MLEAVDAAVLVAEAQVLIGEALGLPAADLDPVLYPPDPVQCRSGWFTLAVREGAVPAARLSVLLWDASTGWYCRGLADPYGVWRETGLPPESDPVDVGSWFADFVAGPIPDVEDSAEILF